jgi:glyoxylase-like metal-dependent hydrolase (beta-lactamase superfamily II)
MTMFNRRQALAAGAALPLAAAAPHPARAAAPMKGASMPLYHRFKLGGFEVTTILAGTRSVQDPQSIFGLDVAPEDFAAASAEAFIPADKAQFFYTPTVVNTGAELILFDTGLAPEGIVGALEGAGYSPEQIDKVVITHMHGDHIGGLRGDAGETFANAAYVTGEVEFDAWDMSGDETFEAKVRPLAEKTTFLKGGDSVASGVTAVEAFGHTPGHMAYMLESEGKGLVIAADFANHYVWSLAHPDWQVLYDRDKAMAAATRKRMLDMMAADKVPFIGYHMPFPALGYVEAREGGYRYVPETYQMMLG